MSWTRRVRGEEHKVRVSLGVDSHFLEAWHQPQFSGGLANLNTIWPELKNLNKV